MYSAIASGIEWSSPTLTLDPGYCSFSVTWSAYGSSGGSFLIEVETYTGRITVASDRAFDVSRGAHGRMVVSQAPSGAKFLIVASGKGTTNCNPSSDVGCVGWTVSVFEGL